MAPRERKPPLAALAEQLRHSPTLAVVSAVAVGFFVGVLLRCFERPTRAKLKDTNFEL